MKQKQPKRYSTDQIVILIVILALTLFCWIYIAATSGGSGGMVMDMSAGADPEMEAAMQNRLLSAAALVSLPSLGMFVPMWIAMCIAMMLPTAIPMILCMQRVCERDAGPRKKLPVWFFILGYVIIWSAFGLVCWGVAWLILRFLGPWLATPLRLWLCVGALFLLCGIYQLSPLKNACLKGCQHPLSFMMEHWCEGCGGALQMGLLHGIECAGCCAALMLVMFPLGMMNLIWMGLFTLLMFFEKNAKFGTLLSKIAGWLLVVAGALAILLSVLLHILKIS